MSDVKVMPAMGIGNYRVELDGQQIGHVRKRSESYRRIRMSNGRMGGTYTYWDAYELDSEDGNGNRVPGRQVARSQSTRRAAVAELVAHYERQRELFG